MTVKIRNVTMNINTNKALQLNLQLFLLSITGISLRASTASSRVQRTMYGKITIMIALNAT